MFQQADTAKLESSENRDFHQVFYFLQIIPSQNLHRKLSLERRISVCTATSFTNTNNTTISSAL